MESLTARMEKLEEVLMGKRLEEKTEEVVEKKVTEMRETLKDKLEIIETEKKGQLAETEKKGQLAETEDRIRRKTNLVIFRLPETKNKSIKEAKEEDEQKVKKGLTEPRTKHTPVDIRRLGQFKKGSEKPRPLRISFANEQARDEVLSSVYRVLKNRKEEDKRLCTQVSIRKDLTVQEREEEDRLYAELTRRRQDSKESGDDKAKWVRRRGSVVNIGNYEVEEEEKANQALGRQGSSSGGRGNGLNNRHSRVQSIHNNKTSSSDPFVNISNCKCIYTNADQYMNKRNKMKALIEINQPDLVGITEVSPKHARFKVQECEIAIEGYELFHNLEEEGRGIALLVRKEIEPTQNDRLSSTFSEHVFVDCTQGDGSLLTVGVIYKRPGSTSENDEKLFELIRNTAGMRKDNLLIFGDFNLPSINWDTESCRNNESHEASQFLQAYTDACLFQHQKDTTRFREGEKPSVVDLVLTNKEGMIKDISTEAGLGKSDNFCLFITLNATTAENTVCEILLQ